MKRPEDCTTMAHIRAEIDRLDEELVALFAQRDPNQARAMQAVWVRFGGETGGAVVLALCLPAALLQAQPNMHVGC